MVTRTLAVSLVASPRQIILHRGSIPEQVRCTYVGRNGVRSIQPARKAVRLGLELRNRERLGIVSLPADKRFVT